MSKTVLITNVNALGTASLPQNLSNGQIGMYSIAANGALTHLTGNPDSTQKLLPLMVAVGGLSGNPRQITFQPKGSMVGATPYFVGATQAVVSPVPNVDIVGYTGASGDTTTITASVAGTYNLTVTNTSKTAPPLPFNMASLYYAVSTAATPFAVASDWTKAINSKTLIGSLQPYDKFVFAELIVSAASTQLATSAPANITGSVINGSTAVTLSGTPATTLAVGSYVRMGSATGTTAPIYRVAAQSGTSLTLDRPYVNPSIPIGSATSAGVDMGTMSAATALASLYVGVRLTSFGNWFNGSAFKELYPNYSIAAGVSGIGPVGTPIVHNGVVSQSYTNGAGAIATGVATVGYGQGWQVQKQEFESQGYIGNTNRSFLPYPVQYYASATSTYSGFTVKYRSSSADASNTGYGREEDNELIVFGLTGSLTGFAAVRSALAEYIV
jgi:hypothetical protein